MAKGRRFRRGLDRVIGRRFRHTKSPGAAPNLCERKSVLRENLILKLQRGRLSLPGAANHAAAAALKLAASGESTPRFDAPPLLRTELGFE